jgi:hypothetical protein
LLRSLLSCLLPSTCSRLSFLFFRRFLGFPARNSTVCSDVEALLFLCYTMLYQCLLICYRM